MKNVLLRMKGVENTKKRYVVLLLLVGAIIMSFPFGWYFYLETIEMMRIESEDIFVRVLTEEMDRKEYELNLPCTFSIVTTDTVPLTVYVTSEEGVKLYKVDADKSKKNISRKSRERSLQSVVYEEAPISPDTLNTFWNEALASNLIYTRTTVSVSATNLHDETSCFTSCDSIDCESSQFTFVAYIGQRCEVKVVGYSKYSWWTVFVYRWAPFSLIVIGAVIFVLFLYYIYRLRHRLVKTEFVYREIIKEKVKFVKEVDRGEADEYRLSTDLIFSSKKQVLIDKGNEKKLAPILCVVLTIFLEAPDHILIDNEILEKLWREDKSATIERFRVSACRLCKKLESVGYFVELKRVDRTKYRLLLPDN